MNITEKLLEARKKINETSIQKEGKNTFSKYDYFTPSQVSQLVNDICQELKILPLFSLNKDELGLLGVLKLIDVESDKLEEGEIDVLEICMRTEMPSIKATNMTQQMGGCETYTKRYMLMSAFDITDNNLDFDSQDNRPQAPLESLKPGTPVQATASEPKPQTIDISIEVLACTQQSQLNELWGKLTKPEQEQHREIFNKQRLKF